MRARAAAPLLAALLPALAAAASDSSLRCAGGLVSLGDATIDLLGKCGAPTIREGRADVTSIAYRAEGGTVKRTSPVAVEKWTYDFGPSQFVMFVTVEGGKVTAIDRGGYGYDRSSDRAPATLRRARCEPSVLHVGDSKLDLSARCGEPTLAERREDLVRVTADTGAGVAVGRTVTVVSEVWTYDFGPQTFVRFVSLEDGVVTRIDTGGHGYAR
jgi:hypothetical protein